MELQFFSDFDGTITKEDTLNKFLKMYANKKWLEIEDDWLKGEIGSKECIEKQMQLFPKMTQNIVDNFLNGIEIDETFPDFYRYLKSENIDFFIVSDGFDYFIEKILARYDITDAKIYSNKLKFEDGKFYPYFPYSNKNCKRKSGVCKCSVVETNKKSNIIVTKRVLYAGDGLSDFCVADKVNTLFAKGSLLEYGKNTKIDNLIGFDSFVEIEKYIKEIKKGERNARHQNEIV